jgi:ABC-type sugar transport system substrate-binding protein
LIKSYPKIRATRWGLRGVSAITALTTVALLMPASPASSSQFYRATGFSPTVCKAKVPAAIASLPKAVSGFTGYKSAPGDWLSLPATSSLTGKRIDVTVMGMGQPFFTAISIHWKHLAVKYKFKLKLFDGKFDAGTVQQVVDDVVADKPDAVVFAPLDSDASVPQLQKFIDAKIPVVTYNVQPRKVTAPRVLANDYLGSQILGCNTGAYFAAHFPGVKANIGVVDLPTLPQVQDRKNGFLAGFLSQIPTAKVVGTVNGSGVIDKAQPAAVDLIQAHPEMNVIFGINDDSSLGAVAALKAAGKYNVKWGVLAATDGSRPALVAMKDPKSPYKAESGYPPLEFAYAAFNLMDATLKGKTKATTQVVLSYPAINPSVAGINKWLASEYPVK